MEDRLATLKNVIKEPELDGWNLYLGKFFVSSFSSLSIVMYFFFETLTFVVILSHSKSADAFIYVTYIGLIGKRNYLEQGTGVTTLKKRERKQLAFPEFDFSSSPTSVRS